MKYTNSVEIALPLESAARLLADPANLLMPSAFHKQSQLHMQDFTAFAEQGKDVREGIN